MKILIKLNWTHMCIGKFVHNFATLFQYFPQTEIVWSIRIRIRIRCVFRIWENVRSTIACETLVLYVQFLVSDFHIFNTFQSFILQLCQSFVCVCARASKLGVVFARVFECVSESKVFRRICWWFEITLRTTFYLAVLVFIVVFNVNWPNVSHCVFFFVLSYSSASAFAPASASVSASFPFSLNFSIAQAKCHFTINFDTFK